MRLFRKPSVDDLKNDAFIIYTEFGPKLRIARDKRLRDAFPQVDQALLAKWMKEFDDIAKELWHLSQVGGTKRPGNRITTEYLIHMFPFLNEKSLKRADFLIRYNAWHEGCA